MDQGSPKVAASQRWKYAQQIEKKLESELRNKDSLPRFQDVDTLIEELRVACETAIFHDFEYASENDIELRLWSSHSLIKDRYRRLLAHFRENQSSRHVERRKLEKRYVDFIKTTQFYYKGYVQRLASHFGGMMELRRVAERLSLEIQTVDVPEQATTKVKELVDKSCYAALLRLGDLARYRNEIRTKDRSWAPALAYYSLADELCPHMGSAHNQMAVIALADVNHLDAVYHLYRAIAVEHPHPLAERNLEIEFKKITTAWEKPGSGTSGNKEATLVLWFVRLHARFYAGATFSGHNELENEVLSRVARLLKEQAFDETFLKLVIINIAAEYFAGERVKKEGPGVKETTIESFYFLLRFNARFLCVLLQTIQPELELDDAGEDLPSENRSSRSGRAPERITTVARRILPAIRQYSIWLVSRALIITATAKNHPSGVYIQEMLRVYASVLTKLIHVFPVQELPVVGYLLEEDEATVGFKPFRDPSLPANCNFYTGQNGLPKPRSTDGGVERSHPNVEMKSRIRNLFVCALVNHREYDFPAVFNADTLEFTFAGDSPQTSRFTNTDFTPPTSTNSERAEGRLKTPVSATNSSQGLAQSKSTGVSDSHQSMDTNMQRMVSSLYEPSSRAPSASKETSYGMHTRTANEVFAPINRNGYQPVRISTQGVIASLPGITNSPFAPQPNELGHHSPQYETAYMGRNISPMHLANSSPQGAMASYQSSAWGTSESRQPNSSASDRVAAELQDSLTRQFKPMSISSSGFSSSSSIYAGTQQCDPSARGGAWGRPPFAATTDDTTRYTGTSSFDRNAMLQSSMLDNNQSIWADIGQTPPGGQRG